MFVSSRFYPRPRNLQQTSYKQLREEPDFALFPAHSPHFLGVRRAICLCGLRAGYVTAQPAFYPAAEGSVQLQRAAAPRANSLPLVCWVGLCTSSLLRMGASGEEKSLQSLWYCLLSCSLPSSCGDYLDPHSHFHNYWFHVT